MERARGNAATPNALNRDNEMENMIIIMSLNPDLSKFPAFKWCVDYGRDWYLPAVNELEIIESKVSKLNEVLTTVGGATFKTDDPTGCDYWSSNRDESNSQKAYLFDFYRFVTRPIESTTANWGGGKSTCCLQVIIVVRLLKQ